jgi:hypothetical protein
MCTVSAVHENVCRQLYYFKNLFLIVAIRVFLVWYPNLTSVPDSHLAENSSWGLTCTATSYKARH